MSRWSDDEQGFWAGARTAFACPWFAVETTGKWSRIRGCGGAIVHAVDPRRRAVFVEIYRPHVEAVSLEMPRGGRAFADEDDVSCALRELHEETGYEGAPNTAVRLGAVWPDTGLMGPGGVGVVSVAAVRDAGAVLDGEVSRVHLLAPAEIAAAVSAGAIGCGLTLAALAMAGLHGGGGPGLSMNGR